MAFDQNVTYKVNIDDSNFQAKLTQMRASLDSTVGGSGFGRSMAYLGPMGGGGNFSSADAGGFVGGGGMAPVTFTPPAIAMQPHFGMFQIQQTLSQARLTSMGYPGMLMNQIGSQGFFGQRDFVPQNMSLREYSAFSTRSAASDASATAMGIASAGVGLSANLIGGGIGTLIGGAFGMPFIGAIAGGMAGDALANSGTGRAVANLGMQSSLAAGSFRFYQGPNQDPLTGRGFNRGDRNAIATSISRMETNDGRLNLDDYRQILEGGSQMGLFEGTKDVKDFEKKFKDLVSTVKSVTTTLHTSLKEGMETIRGLRDMGISDPMAQQQMIMRSETLGRASGRTGMEMMAAGQAGAEIFRGTGVSMQRGFELNQQNTSLVRQMLNAGTLSRETVAHAGGEAGLAQQMTAGALAGFQTLQGRGAMMAAFNPATRQFDPNMVSNMMGNDSMSVMANAANLGPGGMFALRANQHKLMSKLNPIDLQLFGAASIASQARTLTGLGGVKFQDAFQALLYEQMGHEVGDATLALLRTDPRSIQANQNQQLQNIASQASGEMFREGKFGGVKYYSNMWSRNVSQPLSEVYSNASTAVGEAYENASGAIQRVFTGETDSRLTGAGAVGSSASIIQNRVNRRVQGAARNGMSGKALEDFAQRVATEESGGGSASNLEDVYSPFKDRIVRDLKRDAYKLVQGKKVGDTIRLPDGTEATIFANQAAGEKYANESGFNVKGTAVDGRWVGISTSQMNESAQSRMSLVADKDAVSKMTGELTDTDMERYIAAGGTKMTAEDFVNATLGLTGKNKFVMGKSKLTQDQANKVQYAAEKMGFTDTMDNARSGTTDARLSEAEKRELEKKVSSAYSNIESTTDRWLSTDDREGVLKAIKDKNEGFTNAIRKFTAGKRTAKDKEEFLLAAKSSKTTEAAEQFLSLTNEQQKYVSDQTETVLQAQSKLGFSAGTVTGVSGATTSALDANNMANLNKLAKEFETTIQKLIDLQGQLKLGKQ
jgi:hypothetical protein